MKKHFYVKMYQQFFIVTLLLSGHFLLAQELLPSRQSVRFYLDSANGKDTATGQSPEQAWKTIQRLNSESLIGGDTVLFQRGGLWRESLQPQNGTPEKPIVYGAYGEGEKPVLQGSTCRNKIEDWKSCAENLWETVSVTPIIGKKIPVDLTASWRVYQEKPADVHLENIKEDGKTIVRLTVTAQGETLSRIQLIGFSVPENSLNKPLLFQCRIRCSKPFLIPSVVVRKQGAPWTNFLQNLEKINVTEDWKTADILLGLQKKDSFGQLVFYLGGAVPDHSVFELEPLSLCEVSFPAELEPIVLDVGNIIFNHGQSVGFKRWKIDELKETGDFWYDAEKKRVVLFAEKNPAELFKEIEFCLKKPVINHSHVHDVVIRNLSLRYGSYGISGEGAKRIVVENCDFSFLGGTHLYTNKNGNPVRSGNGIEWWNEASDYIVQSCRFWEIYDVAISPQGNAPDKIIKNIIIRNNIIWCCEQSFEYWRTGGNAVTENVVFENNTCVDAGFGWSHRQRPDKRGTHFLSYNVTVKTDIVLRNNIFCNAKDDSIFMHSDWKNGMKLYNNLWFQPKDQWFLCFCGQKIFKAEEFEKYLEEFGIEKNSLMTSPKFVDPVTRNYQLAPESAGHHAASDGGSVGAR
ncbi:MAG: right-handed parallel beta-helix repeat-containing protein [Planctomycetaceae bacterium]|jgi:hypothetical protein|nr:right-handed parallel beta-helix repeat-containing protein [Planctomycetaceae bacterium]